MTLIFLDANVYFSGFFSKEGASRVVLELARRGKVTLLASELVLREAGRNLSLKTNKKTVDDFHHFLKETKIRVVPPPEEKELKPYEDCIHPKDVPILTAAVKAKADFLVTLDRRHFMTDKVLACAGEMKILTPGDFLHDALKNLGRPK